MNAALLITSNKPGFIDPLRQKTFFSLLAEESFAKMVV